MEERGAKKLYIVGAGPGNVDLLTIKAYRAVENAQVILYDNLVNREILEIADKNCILCYVGKKPYGESMSQHEINENIAFYCARYDRVVRLKGGDPYIFGRGFEEWAAARELGVAIEYVPGISSMQGAGLADIPLTHRGVSEGIWAMTAMKQDGSLSSDLLLAVQSKSTVVIYMGMGKLDEIVRTYVLNGKGEMPAAVVQHASLPQQKQVLAPVKDLVKLCRQNGMSHPAIIIIGAVADLQHALAVSQKYRSIG